MKVVLVVADWCPICPSAKALWRTLNGKHRFEYSEVEISTSEGEKLVEKHGILSVPTTIIDGKVSFTGVPDLNEAEKEVRNDEL